AISSHGRWFQLISIKGFREFKQARRRPLICDNGLIAKQSHMNDFSSISSPEIGVPSNLFKSAPINSIAEMIYPRGKGFKLLISVSEVVVMFYHQRRLAEKQIQGKLCHVPGITPDKQRQA